MTDIYLSSQRRFTGCWIRAIVLIALAAALAWGLKSCFFTNDSELTSDERTESPPANGIGTPTPRPTKPSPLTSASRQQIIERANTLRDDGQLQAAREILLDAWRRSPNGDREIEDALSDLHTQQVFSRLPMPEKTFVRVQRGDTLGKLAIEHNSTIESIATMNNISGTVIRLGQELQIFSANFRVVVDKSSHELIVYIGDDFFKRYIVGSGKNNSTPIGTYEITHRLAKPVWYAPDRQTYPYGHPDNLLGTHYLQLNAEGIGLHGTWEPDSVGSQSSLGCIRLKNEDIEQLYFLLTVGTEVVIKD